MYFKDMFKITVSDELTVLPSAALVGQSEAKHNLGQNAHFLSFCAQWNSPIASIVHQ